MLTKELQPSAVKSVMEERSLSSDPTVTEEVRGYLCLLASEIASQRCWQKPRELTGP